MSNSNRDRGRSPVGLWIGAVGVSLLVGAAGAWAQAQPGNDGQRTRDRGNERGGDRAGGRFGGGFGMMGGRNMFEPSVTTRSLETYGKMLGLTADQETAAKALLEGYQQSHAAMADQARDKMAEMRESMRDQMNDGGPNPEMFRKMGDEFAKFRKAGTDLEDGFFSDMKAVLTAEQLEKWPMVERLHRRESSIGRGLLAGERVDLIKMVEDAKLPAEARTTLEPVLNEYAAELDREIVSRNAAYDAAQGKMRELFQDPTNADALKAFESGRAAGLRLRDVNRKYARQIEGLLPAADVSAFNESFRRESYPEIYRATYATRALSAAAEMSGLDENQKSTIASIKESYTRDLNAVNKEMEEARDKRESTGKLEDLMPRRWGGGRDQEADPLRERQTSLQDAALDKLKNVLTAEQFAALPERRGGGGEGGGRGGDDGGRGGRNRDRDREARPAAAPRSPNPGPT